jgi:hypothetical protein
MINNKYQIGQAIIQYLILIVSNILYKTENINLPVYILILFLNFVLGLFIDRKLSNRKRKIILSTEYGIEMGKKK